MFTIATTITTGSITGSTQTGFRIWKQKLFPFWMKRGNDFQVTVIMLYANPNLVYQEIGELYLFPNPYSVYVVKILRNILI